MDSALVIPHTAQPAAALATKLCGHLHNKLHPILLDTNLNGASGVALNLYQAFLLTGMKLHAYVCTLPRAVHMHETLVCRTLEQAVLYASRTCVRVVHECARLTGVEAGFSLSALDVQWLGLTAFRDALVRKRKRHTGALLHLSHRLSRKQMTRRQKRLTPVTDAALSQALWALQY